MATYVYGIVPGDVEANPDARGLGDPPRPISVVRHGEAAALVSEIDADGQALGEPQDLAAHARVLDGVAAVAPVLPLRFGAVLTDEDAVVRELLAADHDGFVEALRQLEGKAEYLIHGRYDEGAILREVLGENPQATQLADAVRELPEDAGRNQRIALGELVNTAVVAKREQDTASVVEALGDLAVMVSIREPTHELDAAYLASLVEVARQRELEELVGRLADEWAGRIELRLLGPMAPYDFVVPRPAASQEDPGWT